jgi:hypothetical protein
MMVTDSHGAAKERKNHGELGKLGELGEISKEARKPGVTDRFGNSFLPSWIP